MATIGFHASHEQLAPSALLGAVRLAEEAGFATAMCSDHLAPWSARQGHSGHAWTWLGAALASTSLPFGVVTAPGQRYHPVMMAQAIATLGELFPGRFWAALGSGEALNEHVTGDRWPDEATRDARLIECVAVLRAAAAFVAPDDVRGAVLVSSDLGHLTAALRDLVELGVEGIALHHVGQSQDRFIDVFGAKVLPELAS